MEGVNYNPPPEGGVLVCPDIPSLEPPLRRHACRHVGRSGRGGGADSAQLRLRRGTRATVCLC